MARKLKYDIAGTDWRVGLEELADPARLFAPIAPHPLVVDIGFGRGEFLLALAEKQPEVAFLGVEVSFKRVLKMARRLAKTALGNVRLVEGRAEEAVAHLPEASVDVAWVNFPDPWPKKRHHRRRLLQPDFVAQLCRRLVPGGVLNVATDHKAYAEHVDAVLSAEPRLENLYAPEPFLREVDDRPRTAYELEWRAEGRDFHFFRYRLR
ncbi:MAG: tRNA (guanosine(46)-N7)-methyltransferase TrmB [Myxococcota bacterium]|nr:tRNA (guanosine(46)-N7)-methyltransferase TrmB [Myxococcota bacterium]